MATSETVSPLAGLTTGEAQEASRLHARLLVAAADQHLLDVAYRTVDSPFGPLLLAATEEGLVRLAYASEGHDAVLQSLADRISPRVLRAPGRLEPVVRELEEYFAGRRQQFTVPLDLRLARGYRLDVLRHLSGISTARPSRMPAWPRRLSTRVRYGRSARPARRIPSRCSCRAIGCYGPMGRWAATSGDSRSSSHCSTWRPGFSLRCKLPRDVVS